MKPVTIVGSHSETRDKAPIDESEIWAFNTFAMKMPRVDLPFQIHTPSGYLLHGENYTNWLFSRNRMMRENYPFEDVFQQTAHIQQGEDELQGVKLLTSSVDFALALAALQRRPRISLYGMDLRGNHNEYRYQREGFMFWVGFCAGKGIPMDIHCADNLFRKPIYGG